METVEKIISNIPLDILLLISIALVIIGSKKVIMYHSMSKWVQVEAVIRSIKELYKITSLYDDYPRKYYYPSIDYQYSYNNKIYSSNNVAFNIQNIWLREVNNWGMPLKGKFWHSWKEGDTISAYVNPEKPGESVLINKFSGLYKNHNITLIVSGVLLGILWIILTIATLKYVGSV